MSIPHQHRLSSNFSKNMTKTLSGLTTLGIFLVNTLGFIDTDTGSALGCGRQWPLCNNHFIPSTWDIHTMIEYGHRGFVALVTLLLLIFVTLAWINYGRWIEVRALGLIAVSFVFLEALLGALGVVFGDPPAELATHFGVSLIAFSAVLLLHLVIRQIDRLPYAKDQTVPAPLRPFSIPRSFMRITFFTLAYLYIAMYIGAYVANSRSADAFRGLLLPQERMTANNHVFWIDSVHRSIGVGLLLLVIYLLAKAYSLRQHRNDLWHITLGIVSCTVLQILAGILLIASQLAIYAQLLHTAIVTVLFAALCYLALQTLPEPSARTRQLPQTYLPEH